MRKERLQNHVSTSTLTLPVCGVLAALLWWAGLGGTFRLDNLWTLLLCLLVSYLLTETNNHYTLLRIRSRMVASCWLAMAGCAGLLLPHLPFQPMAAALCLASSYYMLFTTYQEHQPVGGAFHALLLLSVGSVFVPQLLYLVPFYLWHIVAFLRAMSFRVLWASFIGVLAPYWCWVAWYLVSVELMGQDCPSPFGHLSLLGRLQPFSVDNYTALSVQQVSVWGLTTVLALLGSVHYLSTSYNDKIKVRMLLYIYTFQTFVIWLLMLLQPQLSEVLMPVLMVSSCPLIAHYFALTHSIFTNLLFLLALLALGAQAYLTIWMPSMNF